MTMLRAVCRVLVGVLFLVVVAGCARTTAAAPPPPSPDFVLSKDASYAMEHLRARQETVDAVYHDDVLAERLPNVLFALDGADPRPLGVGVIVGEVVDVQPGRGYVAEEDDVGGREIAFDSPKAMWRTMSVTVATTETWGITAESVSFGLGLGANVDRQRMLRGIRDLGRVIVSLGAPGFDSHDESLLRVERNGSLIGPVDEHGNFSLPALGDSEETYLAGLRTLASIRAAAQRPSEIIRIDGLQRRR